MKTGFHDPIQAKPKSKKVNIPWNFEAPQYDDRTHVCAGTNYGIGHNQPVGHQGNPKQFSPVLPQGRVKTMSTDRSDYKIEIEE